MSCGIGSIRYVVVKTVSGYKNGDTMLSIEYYFVDDDGHIGGLDAEKFDGQGFNKWTVGGGHDWYCLSCKDEFDYWDDVVRHIAPKVEDSGNVVAWL